METRQKTGGRQIGTPNRTALETKILLQSIVNNELDDIVSLLEQLTAKERLDAIIKLLPYIVPKQLEAIKEDVPGKEFTVKIIDNDQIEESRKLEKYIELYGELN